jgi:hypothetical protein
LNKKGLSYYTRDVPKNFDYSRNSIKDIQNDKGMKPKYCIPLDKILSVSNMTEKDRTYYKKFFKDRSDGGFKIIFDKRALKKKEDLVPDSAEQSMTKLQPDDASDNEGDASAIENKLLTNSEGEKIATKH